MANFTRYDCNRNVNSEIYNHLDHIHIRILPNATDVGGNMNKEMKSGAYSGNLAVLLIAESRTFVISGRWPVARVPPRPPGIPDNCETEPYR